jgi:signal transduction histidine kinase
MNEADVRSHRIQREGALHDPHLLADRRHGVAVRTGWHGGRRPDPATMMTLRTALEQALRRATQALEQVQAMEQAADAARADEIHRLAVVAHELRNPLASMRNAAAILGRGRPEDTPRVQVIIEQQIANMSRMIDDLIDMSRTHTGKLTLAPERVSLRGIVDQARETWTPALARRRQTLRVDATPPDCAMTADPLRVMQILGNLLGNASKYSPDGTEIRLEVELSDRMMTFGVSDNGIGIAADALPHVFEPFMQESRAASFDRSGLGVGLAVVRELVEAHGGTVAVSSAGIGRGARFEFTLPRCS